MDTRKIKEAREKWVFGDSQGCFLLLNEFFDGIELIDFPLLRQLRNETLAIQARHYICEKDKRMGIISSDEISRQYNNYSLALIHIFTSIIDEVVFCSQKLSKADENKELQSKFEIIVNAEELSQEEIEAYLEKIRLIFSLKPSSFLFSYKRTGSVIIGVNAQRDYSLLRRLKSVVKIGIVDNLVSITSLDKQFELTCDSLVNFRIDLSGLQLPGINLKEIDLGHANLKSINLERANLQGANLLKSELSFANLREANLKGSILQSTNLLWGKLEGADLSGAKLLFAKLPGANLRGAKLNYASLVWTNLLGIKLSKANLEGANFQGANLESADFQDATLNETNFEDANLSKAVFFSHQRNSLIQLGVDISIVVFIDQGSKNVPEVIFN